jgi:hypothetical protein
MSSPATQLACRKTASGSPDAAGVSPGFAGGADIVGAALVGGALTGGEAGFEGLGDGDAEGRCRGRG